MRLAITLPTADAPAAASTARTAEQHGLDLVVVPDTGACDGAPIPLAASVAAVTTTVAIVVEVVLGHQHPLYAAEEIAVLDRLSRGRTVVLARSDPAGTVATFSEALHLVRSAWGSRPFRSVGPTWPVPADLPANRTTPGGVRVMPAPAQLEVPVWVDGEREVASEHGLPWVVPASIGADDGCGHVAPGRDVTSHGLRPSWVIPPPSGAGWTRQLVEHLRRRSSVEGLDVALVRAAGDPSPELIAELGSRVRAAVQLDHLPEGLLPTWGLGADLDP